MRPIGSVYAEVPSRVGYELTAAGRTLTEPAVALAEGAVDHDPEVERSRAAPDASADRPT